MFEAAELREDVFGREPSDPAVVNVASVPKRSPFRYPGGKTWLVPRIRQWLGSLPERANEEERSNVEQSYMFAGTLVREEMGRVVVEADNVEDAVRLLKEGEWTELSALAGYTEFEWDGQDPEVI